MGPTAKKQAEVTDEEPKEAKVVEITTAIVPAVPTPISVLQEAVQRGANVETLTKLLELQERWEANEARKAFTRDLAAFKAESPRLEKVKEVDFTSKSGGRVRFKYAPLDYVCGQLQPILSRHNLSHTWEIDQSNPEKIRVTCLLEHALGHIKKVSMESSMIDDQRMNILQRLRATVSMLERYTLESATGTASADVDSEFEGISMEEAADFLALISESQTIDELKKNYQDAIKDALAKQSHKAIELYMKARQKREGELRA